MVKRRVTSFLVPCKVEDFNDGDTFPETPKFSGELPESFGKVNSLALFKASNNHFISEFPQWIGKITSLEYLELSNNQFTGSIPQSIGEPTSLTYLSISNNKLVGNVPLSLSSCTRLSVIRLRGNGFNRTIPEGLFGLRSKEIDVSHNGLLGSVPAGSEKLIVLNLRNSALYGSVPADIYDSGNLEVLQLDGNSLKGSIPDEIRNCTSLYLLRMLVSYVFVRIVSVLVEAKQAQNPETGV
ncbi:hypothetical protein RJT34_12239 [Clitoria ternatea]|uniref:Uncharacterized protein n=1 Tax=Clitoria ternatea TaxID=43366 RepID=A0AAN9JND5_CLITE